MMAGGNGWDSTVNLDNLQQQIAQRAQRGVLLAAEHILGESTALVPLEERTLQDSGKTSSESDATGATAAVSYDTPYAVRQHEELDYRHDQGRTAKYLERPAQQAASNGTAAAIIATELRKAMP